MKSSLPPPDVPPPDDHLFLSNLQAARKGDPDALGALLEDFRHYLTVTATRELGQDLQPKLGASDLVQQTFLEAQADFAKFNGLSPQEFVNWLRQILMNNVKQCANKFRGTKKRNLNKEISLQSNAADSTAPRDLLLDTPSPSEKVIFDEECQNVQEALHQLPDDYQQVLKLRHQSNKSFPEIGAIMQRSPEAVRKLWTRAVLLLQRKSKAHEPQLPEEES